MHEVQSNQSLILFKYAKQKSLMHEIEIDFSRYFCDPGLRDRERCNVPKGAEPNALSVNDDAAAYYASLRASLSSILSVAQGRCIGGHDWLMELTSLSG